LWRRGGNEVFFAGSQHSVEFKFWRQHHGSDTQYHPHSKSHADAYAEPNPYADSHSITQFAFRH
jgi:hypothetical protein